MFYEKTELIPAPSRRKILLSRFKGIDPGRRDGALPCDYAREASGFGFKDGCLISGPGARVLKGVKEDHSVVSLPDIPYPEYACKIDVYRNDEPEDNFNKIILMFYNGAAALSAGKFDEWYELFYYVLSSFETGANVLDDNGKPVYLMVCPEVGFMCVHDGDGFIQITSTDEVVTAICKHADRVFAVMSGDESSVLYSDAFDIYNWDISLDAGGYITFDRDLGRIRRLVSFADYLFVFCDYGIYRVNARGDQLSFSVKRLFTSSSRIYPETIVEAGERVIFCAADGIYSFNGYDVNRICTRLNDYFSVQADGMCAAYCKHKYYLSFRICEGEWTSGENNALAVLDLSEGEVSLSRGLNIYSMATLATTRQNTVMGTAVNNESILEILPDLGSFMGQELEKSWKIEGVDMGEPGALKVIAAAESNSPTPFTLVFTSDEGVSVEVDFEPGKCARRVGISGRRFDVQIKTSKEDVLIRPIELTVDFFEGEK